jgi:hypothetical protein
LRYHAARADYNLISRAGRDGQRRLHNLAARTAATASPEAASSGTSGSNDIQFN